MTQMKGPTAARKHREHNQRARHLSASSFGKKALNNLHAGFHLMVGRSLGHANDTVRRTRNEFLVLPQELGRWERPFDGDGTGAGDQRPASRYA